MKMKMMQNDCVIAVMRRNKFTSEHLMIQNTVT